MTYPGLARERVRNCEFFPAWKDWEMFIIKTNRGVGTIWENYLTQIQHIQYTTAINEQKKNSYIYFVYFLLLITSKAFG